MDPDEIPQGQGADHVPNSPCVDGKRLRRSVPPADPVSEVLSDDNLLMEILQRLPPKPSSLPRASLVCTCWRNILSNPQFLKSFRKHHRKPPLLGFFVWGGLGTNHSFTSVLDPPHRIPVARFSVPYIEHWEFKGCRHGLAVLINRWARKIVIWDPLTGQQHHVTFPPGIDNALGRNFRTWGCAMLCADAEYGHVHGDCFSSPFKLVLVCVGYSQAFGSLYDSASGVWGNICSTVTTNNLFERRASIFIGNALCWLISGALTDGGWWTWPCCFVNTYHPIMEGKIEL